MGLGEVEPEADKQMMQPEAVEGRRRHLRLGIGNRLGGEEYCGKLWDSSVALC